MLMGQNLKYCLPHDIPANEFMNLEGQKISTSRNWAIWVDEFARDFPGDFLRYYLAVNAPEKGDSDFSFKDFQLRINGELNNVLGNLANRVFAFSVKNFDGVIPPISSSDAATAVLDEAKALLEQINDGYREYQVKKNTRLIMDIARLGNRWFDERKPWAAIKEDRAHVAETLRVCAELLAMISVALYPILPGSMNRLRKMMGLPDTARWDDALLPKDYPVTLQSTHPLFSKVTDEQVEAQLAKLQSVTVNAQPNTEPLKPSISYDEFSTLDIRVAKVIEAARVPKTDKLLHLKVDIGNEIRELVAGIAESYAPEQLIGQSVAMVVNLEPRKIRGIESRGMILAVHSEGKLTVVGPQGSCLPGSVIK